MDARRLGVGLGIAAGLASGSVRAAPPASTSPGATTANENQSAPGDMRLRRTLDGGFRQVNRQAGFEATIHPDGKVTFRDIPRIGFRTSAKSDNDGSVGGMFRGPYAPKQDPIAATGNPRVANGAYGAAPILGSVGFTLPGLFNTGRKGAKIQFLRDTEVLRAELAASAEHDRIVAALARLGDELQTLWRDGGRTMAERRALLFERWDELEEAPREPSPSPVLSLGAAGVQMGSVAISPGQQRKQSAGELARRRIEAFIRKVAPHGSAQAFTPAELRRFNAARVSRQRFDPYAAQASD